MKPTNFLISIAAASILLFSCKKDNVQPGAPSGSTNTGTNDFIEFKIDGVKYRIDEIQSPTLYSIGVVSKYDSLYNSNTGLTSHAFSFHFMNVIGPNSLTDVVCTFFSNQTLGVGTFHYGDSTANMGMPLLTALVENTNSYVMTNNIKFTLNINSIQKYIGGKITGEFAAENLDLKNQSGTILSSGHRLSDGKFSLTFE